MAKVTRSRAFDAFMPDTEPGEELPNARLLPLDCIEPNPHQSRQAFAPEKLEELAASIREHGVLEPILVQAVGEDRFRILAGERRYRAARAMGLTQIPAIIRSELTEEMAAFITATENLQRADLDIEDEARQFAYLLQPTGLTQRALSEKLGVGYKYITRRIRLLERPDLLATIREGRITQRDALFQMREEPELPVRMVERADLDGPSHVLHGIVEWDTVSHSTTDDSNGYGNTVSIANGVLPTASPALHGVVEWDTVSHSTTDDSNNHGGETIAAFPTQTTSANANLPNSNDNLDNRSTDSITGPPTAPRWRYVEEAERALRRIDARAIPSGERPAWLRQVTALEALVADLKGRLVAMERETP